MNMTELQKLSTEELRKKLEEAQGQLQKLRFDIATMKETKVHKVKLQKKLIARIQTLLSNKDEK